MASSHHFLAHRSPIPSKADLFIKAEQNRKYVRQLWFFLTAVIALLSIIRFVSFLVSLLRHYAQPASGPVKDKEKMELEVVEPMRSRRISWRRFPHAAVTAFRLVAFRWAIPTGLEMTVSISEIVFIIGYIVANLIWLLVDSQYLVFLWLRPVLAQLLYSPGLDHYVLARQSGSSCVQ